MALSGYPGASVLARTRTRNQSETRFGKYGESKQANHSMDNIPCRGGAQDSPSR